MSNRPAGESFAGIVTLLLAGVGILATFFGFLAVVNETDYVGGGLCLLAAAYALGQLVNALYRA